MVPHRFFSHCEVIPVRWLLVLTALVFSLPAYAQDWDVDGILDDGDGNGTVGDNPCTGGVTANCDDNCRYELNTNQSDVSGDGIGDACQCGDTNNSGFVTASDSTVLFRALAGLSPYFSVASGLGGGGPGLAKCNVAATPTAGVAGCTSTDAIVIQKALSSPSWLPGIKQGCDAANPP